MQCVLLERQSRYMPMSDKSFSAWLRNAREQKGWSGERLAEEVRTTQGNISQYERGDRTPRRKRIVEIATALGMPADDALIAAGYLPSAEPTATINILGKRISFYDYEPSEELIAVVEVFIRTSAQKAKPPATSQQLKDLDEPDELPKEFASGRRQTAERRQG